MPKSSSTHWRTSYVDPQTLEVVHLCDRKDVVSFTWAQRYCGISRKTLMRARDRGEIQVFFRRAYLTRTDWLYLWITNRDKSRIIPTSKRITKHENISQPGVQGA
jgi:hypothetical protein